FVVDRDQLFVGGLELFLGGLQLLVQALQLLVGGERLLGGVLAFFARRLVLFNDRQEALLGVRQFLFQAGDLTILQVRRFARRGRRGRRFRLADGGQGFEKDQQRGLLPGVQRHHLHRHFARTSVAIERDALLPCRLAGGLHMVDQFFHFQEQTGLRDQLKEIET